jgi:hypothetical protein
MAGISGNKREFSENAKKIGVFVGKVVAINPDREELIELLKVGEDKQKDFKDPEYLGEDEKSGKTTLRITFWLEDLKSKGLFNVSFFLRDEDRSNKDGSKFQFIDDAGNAAWGVDEKSLPEWVTKSGRIIRKAKVGEEELYGFLRSWLSSLDLRSAENTLEISWEKLMKGNVRELRDQINGEFHTDNDNNEIGILAVATINQVDKKDPESGETVSKDYQQVNNRFFLPGNQIKFFRATKYTEDKVDSLRAKKSKDLKFHEKFVVKATDPEYGIKEIYCLDELKDYNPDEHFAARSEAINQEDSSY